MDQRKLCSSAVRVLACEAIQKAKSGHPGIALGAAPAATALFYDHLCFDPQDPGWVNRDRFILSAGHGSAMLYALLHVFGYDVTIEDLKKFRQTGSRTPGHPELFTPGVDAASGPLGQGVAMAVGEAMAEARLAAMFPGAIDHYTYVLCGDGCLMEGIASEAASLAGTQKLSKLILLYDRNKITIEGDTDAAFAEDVPARFKAYGWNVLEVADGNDMAAISGAIADAKEQHHRPSIIIVSTKIGAKSPLEGSAKTHGEPLGEENLHALKETLAYYPDKDFYMPEEAYAATAAVCGRNKAKKSAWEAGMKTLMQDEDFKARWDEVFTQNPASQVDEAALYAASKPCATRAASNTVLNILAAQVPSLWGGSADLAPSNKTDIKGAPYFSPEDRLGRNIHYGIREHAMAAIANGMALHGGVTPYVATFLVFSDYLRHAVRMSAIMKQRVIYVFTHDSIGVGEDGPTHQPIEQMASFRAMPGVSVFRPADANETAAAYMYALRHNGPTMLALSRQNLPLYEMTGKDAERGGYVLRGKDKFDAIIIATGSEVETAMKAADALEQKGVAVRVVSMPCIEAFEAQSAEYRESVLPASCQKRLVIEAGTSFGWHKYADSLMCIDTFGESGPAAEIFEKFGFTPENAAAKVLEMLK